MKRTLFAAIAAVALASCATDKAAAPALEPAVAPPRPSPELCADPPASPTFSAADPIAIERPLSEALQPLTEAFLAFVHDLAKHDADMAARARATAASGVCK